MEPADQGPRPGVAKRLVMAVMTAMPMTLMCLASSVSYAQLMVHDTNGVLSANFVAAANFCSVGNAIWMANAVSFSPITMTSPDMTVVIFLKHILHTIASSDLPPEVQVPTMCVALHVGSALLGFSFFLLGRVRMAVALNYLPYPVTAGFLAMVGAAIVKSSLALLWPVADQTPLPLVFGCILASVAFVLKQFGVPTNLTSVVSIIVSLVGFNIWIAYTGHTQAELRELGWLFPGKVEPVAPLSIWQLDLPNVSWRNVVPDADALTLVFVACINRALIISGIESASGGVPYSIDDEMQNQGLTTVVVGAVCGTAMNPSVGLTSLCKEGAGGDTWVARATAWIMSGSMILVWASGVPLPNYLPRFLLGGLLMMMGVGMLFDWAWTVRRRMKWTEQSVIYGMVAFSLFSGLIPGVVLGITLAVFVTNMRFAQLDVLKYHVSGVHYRAGEVLTSTQRTVLRDHGDSTQVIGLTGYLFEGVAIALCRYLREVIRSADNLQTLVLDCGACQGINSSACMHIMKVVNFCATQDVRLLICDLNPEVAQLLQEWGADTAWCQVGGRVQEAMLEAETQTLGEHDEALETVRPRSRDGAAEREALGAWLGAEAAEEIFSVARLVFVKDAIALVREGDLPPHMYIAVPEFSDVHCEVSTGTGDRPANLYRTTHGAICAPDVLCGAHCRGSWVTSSDSMCLVIDSANFGLLNVSLPLLLAAGFRQKSALMDQLSALYTVSRGGGWKGVAFDESTRLGDLMAPGGAKPPRGCKECLSSILPCFAPKGARETRVVPSNHELRQGSSGALFASPAPGTQKKDLQLAVKGVDTAPLLPKHEERPPSPSGMKKSASGNHLVGGLLSVVDDDEDDPGSPLLPSKSGFSSGMKKSASGNHLVSGLLNTGDDFDEDDGDDWRQLLSPAVQTVSYAEDANLVLNRRSLSDGHSSAHAALHTLGLPQRRTAKRTGVADLFAAAGQKPDVEVLEPVLEPSGGATPLGQSGKENVQDSYGSPGGFAMTGLDDTAGGGEVQSMPVAAAKLRPKGAVEQATSSKSTTTQAARGSLSAMLRPLMTGDENPLDVQFRADGKSAASPKPSPTSKTLLSSPR